MAGITNVDFAKAVDCNHSMASRLRSGSRFPSAAMLARICRAYNLPMDDALAELEAGLNSAPGLNNPFAVWLRSQVFDALETGSRSAVA